MLLKTGDGLRLKDSSRIKSLFLILNKQNPDRFWPQYQAGCAYTFFGKYRY